MTLKTNTLKLDSLAADPAAPADGTIWHNDTDDRLRKQLNGVTETIACLSDIPTLDETQCGAEPIGSFAVGANGTLAASVSFATAFTAAPSCVTATACTANGCQVNVSVSNVSNTGFDVDLGTNDATDIVEVKYYAAQ